MKIYLCGPINACTDEEARDWRSAAKTALPEHEWLDPMDRDYRGREDVAYKEIVESDKHDIDMCELMLVNYVKPSVGTSMEILYAWERHKPVVLVATLGTPLSPWLRYHITRILPSFQEAFRWLAT